MSFDKINVGAKLKTNLKSIFSLKTKKKKKTESNFQFEMLSSHLFSKGAKQFSISSKMMNGNRCLFAHQP